MNLSDRPNLKPIRDYSEYDVLNMFAATGVLNKGTFVTLVNTNSGNTNVFTSGNTPRTPYQTTTTAFGNAPGYAYSVRGDVEWQVKQATAGDPVLGVLLYDVKETNAFGENFRYRPVHERHEQQVALIGESVPILKRGVISTNSYTGTPIAGSGGTVSGGKIVVGVYSKSTSVGMFLSSADADGYALFSLNCL